MINWYLTGVPTSFNRKRVDLTSNCVGSYKKKKNLIWNEQENETYLEKHLMVEVSKNPLREQNKKKQLK